MFDLHDKNEWDWNLQEIVPLPTPMHGKCKLRLELRWILNFPYNLPADKSRGDGVGWENYKIFLIPSTCTNT